jgi:hypothetical protein
MNMWSIIRSKYVNVPINNISSWSASSKRQFLLEKQKLNMKILWYTKKEFEGQQFPKQKGRI